MNDRQQILYSRVAAVIQPAVGSGALVRTTWATICEPRQGALLAKADSLLVSYL